MYNYVSKDIFAKMPRSFTDKFSSRKNLTKNYLVNILSVFEREKAESLPDLFQKIFRSSQCQCTLSTHIVNGNKNLNAVISALCISHCEILQNIF